MTSFDPETHARLHQELADGKVIPTGARAPKSAARYRLDTLFIVLLGVRVRS